MENSELIKKVALDKNYKKLGKIVRLDKIAASLDKKQKLYAFVDTVRLFQRYILVPISLEKILWTSEEFVCFNILKKEIDDRRKLIKKQSKEQR